MIIINYIRLKFKLLVFNQYVFKIRVIATLDDNEPNVCLYFNSIPTHAIIYIVNKNTFMFGFMSTLK